MTIINVFVFVVLKISFLCKNFCLEITDDGSKISKRRPGDIIFSLNGVRLNYATTHHHPPPTTISQNIFTITHHHPPPAKIHPPPPTTTQKMDYHPAKAKIYWYIAPFDIVLTVSFSLKYNISMMKILFDKVLISSFFKFKISTTFYVI